MTKPIMSLLVPFIAHLCFAPGAMLIAETTIQFEQDLSPQVPTLQRESDPVYRANPHDDLETKLLKERIRAVLDEIEPLRVRVSEGNVQVYFLFDAQKRLNAAQLEFHKKPEKIISLLEANLNIARQIELERKQRFENGVGRPDDYYRAKFYRASAELKLFRAQKNHSPAETRELPAPVMQDEDLLPTLDNELLPINSAEMRPPLRSKGHQSPVSKSIEQWKRGDFSSDVYKIKSGDDQGTRLKKQRINMALMEKDHFKKLSQHGVGSLDENNEAQKRLLQAQLDFHTSPKEIVTVLQEAFESARAVESIVSSQFNEGADVNIQQVGQAMYYRLNREIELLHARKKFELDCDSLNIER